MSERKKPSQELKLIATNEAGSAYELAPEKSRPEQIRDSWTFHRGNEILSLAPQTWKIPNWIPNDSLVMIYAEPGVGKSFFALSFALEVARGGEWLGTPLTPEPVLYLAGERLSTLRDRCEAWTKYHRQELPSRFFMPEFHGYSPHLSDEDTVEAVSLFIKEQGIKLVIIDTYATLTTGIDESSSKDTGPAMASLSKLRADTCGGTVAVVHHSGKNKANGPRGSTAFMASADVAIKVSSGGERQISASVEMTNSGTKPLEEWYEIETVPLEPLDGEPRSSAVLKATGAPKKDEALEELVKQALLTCVEGSLSKSKLRAAVIELRGKTISESHFDRVALKGMISRGEVRVTGKASLTRYQLSSEVLSLPLHSLEGEMEG
jgi:hypothetical protein